MRAVARGSLDVIALRRSTPNPVGPGIKSTLPWFSGPKTIGINGRISEPISPNRFLRPGTVLKVAWQPQKSSNSLLNPDLSTKRELKANIWLTYLQYCFMVGGIESRVAGIDATALCH